MTNKTDERFELIEALEKLEALQIQDIVKRASTDLFFLSKTILGYELMEKHVHQELCWFTEALFEDPKQHLEWLEEYSKNRTDTKPDVGNVLKKDVEIFKNHYNLAELKKDFRLLLMPRGSFKTSLVTISYTLQLLLKNPNIRILIDSENFEKSCAFVSEIRSHLEGNDTYREIFKTKYGVYPDAKKKSVKWTDSGLNIAARTKEAKEPTITASGIGATKVGMHYDVIIADDLQSEKNTTTKELIDQVIRHYRLALSLLDPGGKFIVIGTRWDYQDVYQHILDNERHRFGVFARQAKKPNGSLLFPERLTEQFLEDTKKSQGTYLFSCQYQNMPVDDKTATFKHSHLRRVNDDSIKGKPINWFLLVDPAISMDESADSTAMVLAGFDEFRNIYVRHIEREKLQPSEMVNKIFALNEKFQPKSITIETVAFQKALMYAINDRSRETGWWLPVREIKRDRTKSKEDRIRRLQPFYEFGHVFHLNSCKNIDELEYELLHFPKGQHDDIIDALADIVEIGFPPRKGTSVYEDDEDSPARKEKRRRDRIKRYATVKPKGKIKEVSKWQKKKKSPWY